MHRSAYYTRAMMPHSTTTTTRSSNSQRAIAYSRVANKSPPSIEYLCNYWINEPAVEMDGRGNTLLHLIVVCGNEEALNALIESVSLQQLKKQNTRGETALHEAARRGDVSIARTLLEWEMQLSTNSMPDYRALVTRNVNLEVAEEESGDLVSIRNKMGEIPLYVAAASGHIKVFRLLETHYSDCNTQRNDCCTVLHAAVLGQYYHLAITIFRSYPQLARKPDVRGNTPLNILATTPSSFKSGSMYAFRNLGRRPFIPLQLIVIVIYYCIRSTHEFHPEADPQKKVRNKFVEKILDHAWIKPIDDTKQKHLLAEELARILIEPEADWTYYSYTEYLNERVEDNNRSQLLSSAPENSQKVSVIKKNGVSDPLMQAIENSIPELVKKIVKRCPDSTNCIDKKGRNVLHSAAEYRNIDIYELLKKHVIDKERMMAEVDFEGNTIVHQTTIITPTSPYISLGIFYSMCWNVFWFVRVSRDCAPHTRYLPNKQGKTATDLFIDNSKMQREEAGKAMKDINGNLMVVAALIGAISFAAIFTIPGGFNQKHGYPLLLESDKRGTELFLGYDATTLFAATCALGNLLSIQLSRFKVDDFCIALPLKYLVAISSMYYAAAYTVTTTLQAFILEECLPKHYLGFVICIGIILSLGYFDSAYYAFSYLSDVLWYSFKYRSQET